jgi:hypothetical protein
MRKKEEEKIFHKNMYQEKTHLIRYEGKDKKKRTREKTHMFKYNEGEKRQQMGKNKNDISYISFLV